MTALEEILDRDTKVSLGREELGQKLANDETISAEEMALFDGWKRHEIDSHVGRIRRALKHRDGARGLDEKRRRLAKAESQFTTKGAGILEQIAALQSQYDSLQRERDDAGKAVADGEAALKALPDLAPPHCQKIYQRKMAKVRETFAELNTLEARKKAIEGHLALSAENLDDQGQILVIGSGGFGPDADYIDSRQHGTNIMRTVNGAKWREYQDQLRQELATIEPRIEELTLSKAVASEEANKAREFYFPL